MAYVQSRHRLRKGIIIGLIFVVAVGLAAGASALWFHKAGSPKAADSPTSAAKTPTPPPKPSLTPAQQASRMVCLGVTTQAIAVQIAQADGVSCFLLQPGGDVLTAAATQAIAAATPVKPILAVDEEGGYVARLGQAQFKDDTAAAMGAMDDATVTSLGAAMGQSIRGIGANLDFAPVLDVDDPDNQAIGYEQRAFSSDPGVIADKAGAFASGLRSSGVIPTYKHFPGLGRATGPTGGNSDTGVATTPDFSALQALDLKPYASLLPGPARTAVMVGNQIVPGLTDGATASLSPAAYQLLRSTYHFNGVVFTDSLSAASITQAPPDAVVAALKAGADLPLVTVNDADSAHAIVQAIIDAITNGQLPHSTVSASLARTDALRSQLP